MKQILKSTELPTTDFEQLIFEFVGLLYCPEYQEQIPLTELRDLISDGQILSKRWLITELRQHISQSQALRMTTVGGWVGFGAWWLKKTFPKADVTTLDQEQRYTNIAVALGRERFRAVCADMMKWDYRADDVIINTVTEHISDLKGWLALIPSGKLIVLQANSASGIPDHINPSQNIQELTNKAGITEMLYAGELHFPQYIRSMVIFRSP